MSLCIFSFSFLFAHPLCTVSNKFTFVFNAMTMTYMLRYHLIQTNIEDKE